MKQIIKLTLIKDKGIALIGVDAIVKITEVLQNSNGNTNPDILGKTEIASNGGGVLVITYVTETINEIYDLINS